MVKVNIRKVRETAQLPTRGTAAAAGYDMYADIAQEIQVQPGQTVKVPTGIAMSIPEGYFGGVFARSGLALKEGLRPAQGTAVIDADYTGEIFVPLHNDSDQVRTITDKERIAQIVLIPFLAVEWNEVEELESTERGAGGFGSTGQF